MKPSVHLGGNAWSQPWHAMHRRLLQNSVRISTAHGGEAHGGDARGGDVRAGKARGIEARGDSWLVRARQRAAQSRIQAPCAL